MNQVTLIAINAKYIHSNLAVHSLKAYAKEFEHQIEILEYTINQQVRDIIGDIYLHRPKMLALSCYIWNREYVERIIHDYSQISPQTPIWIGGPEAYHDARGFMECCPGLTGVMVGEGEEVFRRLTTHYLQQQDALKEIPGIWYRDEAGALTWNQRAELLDMNQLPFVYQEMEQYENKIIYYESSRGCPFSCSYCLSSVDKTVRFRDIELVKEELSYFLQKKVPQVKFVDRTFNCNKQHAMEIWRHIMSHWNGITNFHFEIAGDLIDDEMLELLEKMPPGMIQFEMGIQSTNPETLQEIQRRMNLEQIGHVVTKINEFGNIHQHLDLIAGLPYEDFQSFRHSFNDVYAMGPEQLQLGFLKVLKGTMMEARVQEYGLRCSCAPPYEVFSTKWISYEQILVLRQIETVVEIYYNSRQFTNTMAYVERYFEDAFSMYELLGIYYGTMFQVGEKHSRMARYDCLLGFLENRLKIQVETGRLTQDECQAEREKLLELLVYDVYLRENAKNRPSYFPKENTETYKAFYRQAKKEGKQVHVEHFRYQIDEYAQQVKHHRVTEIQKGPEKHSEDIAFYYDIRDAIGYGAKTEKI